MADLTKSEKLELDKLIAAGDLAGAQALLAGKTGSATATGAADTSPAAPPPPRRPEEVLFDLIKGIHSLLGNSPALVPLVNEYQEVTALTPAEEPPKQ